MDHLTMPHKHHLVLFGSFYGCSHKQKKINCCKFFSPGLLLFERKKQKKRCIQSIILQTSKNNTYLQAKLLRRRFWFYLRMGFVGQLVRCNILCKKQYPYWKCHLKQNGGIWSCTETYFYGFPQLMRKKKVQGKNRCLTWNAGIQILLAFSHPLIFLCNLSHRYLCYWDFNQISSYIITTL